MKRVRSPPGGGSRGTITRRNQGWL